MHPYTTPVTLLGLGSTAKAQQHLQAVAEEWRQWPRAAPAAGGPHCPQLAGLVLQRGSGSVWIRHPAAGRAGAGCCRGEAAAAAGLCRGHWAEQLLDSCCHPCGVLCCVPRQWLLGQGRSGGAAPQVFGAGLRPVAPIPLEAELHQPAGEEANGPLLPLPWEGLGAAEGLFAAAGWVPGAGRAAGAETGPGTPD